MTPTIEDLKAGKRVRIVGKKDEWFFIGLNRTGSIILEHQNGSIVPMRLDELELIPDPPREFWVNVYPDGSFGGAYKTKEQAEKINVLPIVETIKVREVIE